MKDTYQISCCDEVGNCERIRRGAGDGYERREAASPVMRVAQGWAILDAFIWEVIETGGD
jgi:hypothetical protein